MMRHLLVTLGMISAAFGFSLLFLASSGAPMKADAVAVMSGTVNLVVGMALALWLTR